VLASLKFGCANPRNADPKPIIDPDRVLSGSVIFQRIEVIIWRAPQVT